MNALESKIRALAARWRDRAEHLYEAAREAGEPDSPSVRAVRREAATYLAGAVELDALVPTREYSTTET